MGRNWCMLKKKNHQSSLHNGEGKEKCGFLRQKKHMIYGHFIFK